jgi:hypothetical protein
MAKPYSPFAKTPSGIGEVTGRLTAENRSVSEGEIFNSAATRSTTDRPQTLPWHKPIPHLVSSFAVLESVAPSSSIANFKLSTETSSLDKPQSVH